MGTASSHGKAVNVFGALALALAVQISAEASLTIDGLSKLIGLSHSATVRLVDRMCARGLVTRVRGSDLREVRLRLTQLGSGTVRQILADRAAALGSAFADFSDEDWRVFEPLMVKVLRRVLHTKQEVDLACRLCDQTICPRDICPAEPHPDNAI